VPFRVNPFRMNPHPEPEMLWFDKLTTPSKTEGQGKVPRKRGDNYKINIIKIEAFLRDFGKTTKIPKSLFVMSAS
jgi:hypothetical protein